MKDLNKYRKEIDKVDSKIIKLYEKRMSIVKNITNYKIINNIPVLDSSRESKMLDKNLNKIKNKDYKKYYESVLKGYLDASKKMQEEIIKENKDY